MSNPERGLWFEDGTRSYPLDGERINAMHFGAVGSGGIGVDDTAALQSAATSAVAKSGRLYLPGGSYVLTDTLVLGSDSGHCGLSLEGDGVLSTILIYRGPPDRPAIKVNGLKYFDQSKFSLQNNAGRGTTTGILMSYGGSGSGSQTNGGTVSHVSVGGFHVGVQCGQVSPDKAASEMLFEHLVVSSCDVGVQAENNNSLNLWFYGLQMAQCGIGMNAPSANGIHVYGGHSSGSTDTDFCFRSFNTCSVRGFRSESGQVFLQAAGGSAGGKVAISECDVLAGGPMAVYVAAPYAVSIEHCYLERGGISVQGGDAIQPPAVTLIDNDIRDGALITPRYGPPNSMGTRFVAFNNRRLNAASRAIGHFRDGWGYVDATHALVYSVGTDGNGVGFNGAAPSCPVLATGAGCTVDDVVSALQGLRLVRQS